MRISYWSSDVCSSDLLKLNRRTAPNLYKTVHPITRDQDGSFAIDGDGEAVDWVLGRERFPDGALWSELADRNALDEEALQKLADALVDFHSRAQIAWRSEDHTSELQSLMRISYAVFCLKKKLSRWHKHTYNNYELTRLWD